MGLVAEFKEFALKGSVVDLAVGVIIGTAFNGVVTSLVKDVMMPALGWLIGGLDFANKIIVIQHKGSRYLLTGKVLSDDVIIHYGLFINAAVQFFIQAVAVFILIKLMNRARRQPEPAPAAPPPLTKDQELLLEIRDSIRAKN